MGTMRMPMTVGTGGTGIDVSDIDVIYDSAGTYPSYTIPASKYKQFLVAHTLYTDSTERPPSNITNGTLTSLASYLVSNIGGYPLRLDTYLISRTDISQATTFEGCSGTICQIVALC